MPIHGTCGNCGGAVTTPELWGGTVPPIPTCSRCHAQPENPHGPVIPMKKTETKWPWEDWPWLTNNTR